jgi:hypothetical protein
MACCFFVAVILTLLFAFPISLGVYRELARTGYALHTVVAVITFIVLFLVAGFIFLGKFRFLR